MKNLQSTQLPFRVNKEIWFKKWLRVRRRIMWANLCGIGLCSSETMLVVLLLLSIHDMDWSCCSKGISIPSCNWKFISQRLKLLSESSKRRSLQKITEQIDQSLTKFAFSICIACCCCCCCPKCSYKPKRFWADEMKLKWFFKF